MMRPVTFGVFLVFDTCALDPLKGKDRIRAPFPDKHLFGTLTSDVAVHVYFRNQVRRTYSQTHTKLEHQLEARLLCRFDMLHGLTRHTHTHTTHQGHVSSKMKALVIL